MAKSRPAVQVGHRCIPPSQALLGKTVCITKEARGGVSPGSYRVLPDVSQRTMCAAGNLVALPLNLGERLAQMLDRLAALG
jgi:hypothetical protein